jgi:hypothetical protein
MSNGHATQSDFVKISEASKKKKYINHSYDFAEYVCFILPPLFDSDGKGAPRKRVQGFNLIHSEKLETQFYEPDGNMMDINTIFQVWSKNHMSGKHEMKSSNNNNIKVYSLSDGGTPSSTRNKKMLEKCDIYLPSTCFGKLNMKLYDNFEELPNRRGYGVVFIAEKEENKKKAGEIEWSNIGFLSTNSAINLRMSQIYKAFI